MTTHGITIKSLAAWPFLAMILLCGLGRPAAGLSLGWDPAKKTLKIEYIPAETGVVQVSVRLEDDVSSKVVETRELQTVRGKRLALQVAVQVASNCLYIVEVLEAGRRHVAVKDLYRDLERSAEKRSRLSQILGIPADLVGALLDRVSSFLLGPGGKALWRIRADGTGLERLMPAGEGEIFTPRVSPDGGATAFVRSRAGAPSEVLILRKGETDPLSVALGTSPVWSPDGGALFYLRDQKLYRRDLAEGTEHEIAFQPGEPLADIVGWSREDASRLLVSYRLGDDFFWPGLLDPATGNRARLPYDRAYLWLSALSPDGKRLVLSEYEGAGGKSRIYLQDLGGERRALTDGHADDESPTWSPDGTIVFISNRP